MSNLDYKVRIELRHELRALQKRIGITAVYVTHDREEALTLADRIAVLDAGRVVQYASPEDIFHRPASAFVAGFMGADNAVALMRDRDGTLRVTRGSGDGERLVAHFRSDTARVDASASQPANGELRLHGRVVQTLYVGQGWRYRVQSDDADVWAHAEQRIDEGASVAVIVPHDALLLFPRAATAG
jgi:ABC-type Fe3+/spermidine/putrescine transport system ATPase subunit